MGINSSNEIYLYDPQTKKLLKEFTSQRLAERELGLYRGAISDYLRKGINRSKYLFCRTKADYYPESNASVEVIENQEITLINTLSEDELRQKHDMFFIILSFVKNIPEGRYVDEATMLRQLSLIGKPRYREALARIELKDHRGKVDGVIYYGSMNSIKKLKQEGVLQ